MVKTKKLWRPIWTSDTFKKSALPGNFAITDTKDTAEDMFLDLAEGVVNLRNTDTFVRAKQVKVSKVTINKIIEEDAEFRGESVLVDRT